jgi:hypothetical protein|tara:strand:- start:18601 stop:19083 length:483 start_codon:yes stop_codon:yes gene_type:complete
MRHKKDFIMHLRNVLSSACFFITTLCFTLSSYADQTSSVPVPSVWENQSGSSLQIETVGTDGLITGTYINRAAGYGCQNVSYPVTGWVYGTALSFNTLWEAVSESCNSITAWAGFLYQGQISALWNLTINGSSSSSQILQGSDTFKQIQTVTNKSLLLKK